MHPAVTLSEHLTLGLKLSEWITISALILGPVMAVAITLLMEGRRNQREQRMRVLRALLATFKVAADAQWSIAMNMLLLEFNRHARVMKARKEYMDVARIRAPEGQQHAHLDQLLVKQIALVYEVASALGYRITEGELRSDAYISEGLITRDNLYLDSLKALRELADSGKRSADASEILVGRSSKTH